MAVFRKSQRRYWLDISGLLDVDVRSVMPECPPDTLRLIGCASIPDWGLTAAAACGVTVDPHFLDTVDSELDTAQCLCCYSTANRKRANLIAQHLGVLQQYHSPDSYVGSLAFYRVAAAIAHPVSDIRRVPGGFVLDECPHMRAALGKFDGWVMYSTAVSRKLARQISSCIKPMGWALSVTTVSDPEVICRLRHKGKLIKVALHAKQKKKERAPRAEVIAVAHAILASPATAGASRGPTTPLPQSRP